MSTRTRFAPSPTGYLHIGGARTALYCWLFAKKTKGKFILRIEDTDVERSTQESVQAIFDGLEWLNLKADEGPFYQTKRLERYQTEAERLLKEGKAYKCYCTRERLDTLRIDQMAKKLKPRYDGHCLELKKAPKKGTPFVIRFKNPKEDIVVVDDLIRGQVRFKNSELDDLVLVRTDGMPTYNFSVVVDDIDMKITHVIRGDDHLNNTPRQINLYHALGEKVPFFAHVPMILGDDGKRLSKRHGAVSVLQYREDGFLPEALLNYLIRLGWSSGDQEIFTMDEMIERFDLKDVNKSGAIFNPEKLLWLNQQYLKSSSPAHIAKHLEWHFNALGISTAKGPKLVDVVKIQADRCKTLREMAEKSRYFFEDFDHFDEKEAPKILHAEILPALEQIRDDLNSLDTWEVEVIHQIIVDNAEDLKMKLGRVAQPVRMAMTGGTVSPPLDATIHLVGKKRAVARLGAAIKYIEELS